MSTRPILNAGDLVKYDGVLFSVVEIILTSSEAIIQRWEQESPNTSPWKMRRILVRVPLACLENPTDSPDLKQGSALVQEMRRLRAMPGNCALANELIDRAIAVQLEAEARTALEAQP